MNDAKSDQTQQEQQVSAVEHIKTSSRGLRGDLAEQMNNFITGSVTESAAQLIKFHGSYLQDDRDRRAEREQKKLEWAYSFMIRLRIPSGNISASQWLGLQQSCDKRANGIIKITTRQTVQFHGVIKAKMKPTMQDFEALGLDAIAACGDVNRNVISGSNPCFAPYHQQVNAIADQISTHLLPRTKAFNEIWLEGEKLDTNQPSEEDPLYQDRYLPRKFKIAIAIPPHNEVDVFAHDLGLIAVARADKLVGFNISIGGGLGATHGNAKTYPRLGNLIGFVPTEKVLDLCWQVAAVQRDHGNRQDRKQARLKYTLDRLGLDFFVKELEKRLGYNLESCQQVPEFTHRSDPFGWVYDHQGLGYYTAFVENGRVVDQPNYRIKSAIYEIAKANISGIRFTANQNIMFTYIKETDKAQLEQILKKNKVIQEAKTPTKLEAMACVALPTCPLALAEGQRYLMDFVSKVERLQEKHGLSEQAISTRITGCPNGCGRAYLAEIGLVGKKPGKYVLRLGGDYAGTRLNQVYQEEVNEAQILESLDELLQDYAKNRFKNESFGDYSNRLLF